MSGTSNRLSVSIVVFQPDLQQLASLLDSLLASDMPCAVTVVDNSERPLAQETAEAGGAVYLHLDHNIGYGRAHNLAIAGRQIGYDYHLVCNPDIEFGPHVLSELTRYMDSAPDVGLVMPRIFYRDGTEQWLCKLLPAPLDLFLRRFARLRLRWVQHRLARYEMAGTSRDSVRDVPSLSGCFMFFRGSVLERTKGFDPRFFLYMEDLDLCRRTGEIARTVYYPHAHILHGYAKGSYSSGHLLRLHLRSAVSYFNKWGWLLDRKRDSRNRSVLAGD